MGSCPPVTAAVAVPSEVCQHVTGVVKISTTMSVTMSAATMKLESAVQPAVSAAETKYSPSKRLSTSTSPPTNSQAVSPDPPTVPMMATPSFMPVQVTFWTVMSNRSGSGSSMRTVVESVQFSSSTRNNG